MVVKGGDAPREGPHKQESSGVMFSNINRKYWRIGNKYYDLRTMYLCTSTAGLSRPRPSRTRVADNSGAPGRGAEAALATSLRDASERYRRQS